MGEKDALLIVDKIFKKVFGIENTKNLDEIMNKFAFDVWLPRQVIDMSTQETTWSNFEQNYNFISTKNAMAKEKTVGWMLPKQSPSSLEDIWLLWQKVNLISTERIYDSNNVFKSDTIYRCNDIYNSNNCSDSKKLVFCDSCGDSEFLLASKRSYRCNFGIRVDDSKNCSGGFNIVYSNKIIDSFVIQDCFDLYECMFCAHIASKKFCIANMQFEQNEYYNLKKNILDWILNSYLEKMV